MKRLIITLFLTISLALGGFGVSWSGDFEKGVDAQYKGDYATAVKIFKSLAEQGNAQAQEQLGLMYTAGWGVIQDYVYAHMWFNIASSNGNDNAGELRGSLVRLGMTQSQVEKATDLARDCVRKNYKDC